MAKKNQFNTKALYKKLDKLFEAGTVLELNKKKRWVIFSDLHMGDGGATDDFKRNANLFTSALKEYYLKKDHTLILNGDVEELQRFQIRKILERWSEVYQLFDQFNAKGNLFKTIGNHDLELELMKELPFDYKLHEALKLKFGTNHLFVFHGHQASKKYQQHNELIGFTLKYFANPLGIKSYSVSHSSKKQYKIEKRVYGFSAFNKVVSIIGHTHRPLFESLHKLDRLKYKIEQLCRDYAEADIEQHSEIKAELKTHKKELKKYYKENKDHSFQSYVYNTLFHIPCLFNSGCVVGKRGMSCLEIEGDKIRLVHWFDKNISKKYLKKSGYQPEQLGKTDFYRLVIDEESLHYIFTRIKFLA
ncbi:Calcineurin-like phosphoesterase superfamily domain-containing protein [Ekhidna lutea]|uniref:Calcineurin-like phosphoesterase superfamily domain-containing protein n=1 Tax=Ekhidna lutea TaxID=447679 RepID=A0A239ISF9_EKHLU|nr:metallophosphoesterase [Ekhidna lutea]SNS96716.1 Calcineurin-like phosphoesterase superfamily domain-containing protein [Ekhidna lutea]